MVPPSAKRALQTPSARGWQDDLSAREPETCSAMTQQGGNLALTNYMPSDLWCSVKAPADGPAALLLPLCLEMQQGVAVPNAPEGVQPMGVQPCHSCKYLETSKCSISAAARTWEHHLLGLQPCHPHSSHVPEIWNRMQSCLPSASHAAVVCSQAGCAPAARQTA